MKTRFGLPPHWHTGWCGHDIVVMRNDAEVDRIHAPDIRRVVFVQPTPSTSAGDLSFALAELSGEFVVFPAETGFAGRVHFERQAFWAAKACVYWADAAQVRLPARCLVRRGLALTRRSPCYGRVPRAELEPLLAQWALEGPQSWDERRWRQIERSRPFSRFDPLPPAQPAAVRPMR